MLKKNNHAENARDRARYFMEGDKTIEKRAENEKKKIAHYSRITYDYGVTLYDYCAEGFCTEEDIYYFLNYYLKYNQWFDMDSFIRGKEVSNRREPEGRINFSAMGEHDKIINKFINFLSIFKKGIDCGLNKNDYSDEEKSNDLFMTGYLIGLKKRENITNNPSRKGR